MKYSANPRIKLGSWGPSTVTRNVLVRLQREKINALNPALRHVNLIPYIMGIQQRLRQDQQLGPC